MTVSYTYSMTGYGSFIRLLFRWKGSVYKAVFLDLVIYLILYSALSLVYRFCLNESHRRTFEQISLHCRYIMANIPLSFLLGFYVSLVIKRWWDQYQSIPWPYNLCMLVSTYIRDHNEESRTIRRSIARYANLSFCLTLFSMSPDFKNKFPTLQHFVNRGIMTSEEKELFNETSPRYWLPMIWASNLVYRAKEEGHLRDAYTEKMIMEEIIRFRSKCGSLLGFNSISIPLVYTQVVTLAVYSYFVATLMGRQFLSPDQNYADHNIDTYIPFFGLLQFFFYMGWLKVAESLANPFGDDDDDFEVTRIATDQLQVSYAIVDDHHNDIPPLVADVVDLEDVTTSLFDVTTSLLDVTTSTTTVKRNGVLPQSRVSSRKEKPSMSEFAPMMSADDGGL